MAEQRQIGEHAQAAAQPHAVVGQVIAHGPIPANVVEVEDRSGDPWARTRNGTWTVFPDRTVGFGPGDDDFENDTGSYARYADERLVGNHGPLKVTKVAEPEPAAEPDDVHYYFTELRTGLTYCGVSADDDVVTTSEAGKATCGACQVAADEVPVAEPQPCPTCSGPVRETVGMVCPTCGTDYAADPQPEGDLLDLVRAHGGQKYMQGVAPLERTNDHGQRAAALYARIEAEVQRLRAQMAEVDRLKSDNERLNRIHATDETAVLQVIGERDDAQEWADRLSQAIAEHLGVDVGEHSNANLPWQAALIALEDAAAEQNGQLVLRLDELPRGALALVGVESGRRYEPSRTGSGAWRDMATEQTMPYLRVMEREGSVRVVMAPPREPHPTLRLGGHHHDTVYRQLGDQPDYDRDPRVAVFMGPDAHEMAAAYVAMANGGAR